MSDVITNDPVSLYREAAAKGIDPRVYMDQKAAETIHESQRCFRCNGTGNQMYWMYQRCEHCNGTGRRHSPHCWAGTHLSALQRVEP